MISMFVQYGYNIPLQLPFSVPLNVSRVNYIFVGELCLYICHALILLGNNVRNAAMVLKIIFQKICQFNTTVLQAFNRLIFQLFASTFIYITHIFSSVTQRLNLTFDVELVFRIETTHKLELILRKFSPSSCRYLFMQ